MNGRKQERCLVLGVNGQDGSYAADHLLAAGSVVCGVGRQEKSKWLVDEARFTYHELDLSDTGELAALLRDFCPDSVFHFAAVHGPAGFVYEARWKEVHLINTITTHAILEYFRSSNPGGKFIYASSSKAFGVIPPKNLSERSRLHSSCIYSITKNATTELINYYRMRHGIQSSVIWMCNHESPRRAVSYFIPRIVDVLAHAMEDRTFKGEVETLQFWCDWGDADEFMRVIVDIAQRAVGQDFVLATGNTQWAGNVVDKLFQRYGLEAGCHVLEKGLAPITIPRRWRANVAALRLALGRVPKRTVQDVCDDILRLNYPEAWAMAKAK